MMNRKIVKKYANAFLALTLSASLLCGCTGQPGQDTSTQTTTPSSQEKTDTQTASSAQTNAIGERPLLVQTVTKSQGAITAQVEPYSLASDLSNVENLWQFYLDEALIEKLAENGFVVSGNSGMEFFEIYESNRYAMIPNFVTVDSLMHTYHVYFSYLLKNIEKNSLSDSLLQLSQRMLTNSISQYDLLKGTEWESAAKRNIAFFTVGTKLLDDSTQIPEIVKDVVTYELSLIHQADGIYMSQVISDEEDYSQYKPRGYYEGDSQLEAYFKAMMWYGRIHFKQEKEDMDRSALLITKALDTDVQAYQLWSAIYAVTSFFAGASDDLGVCEYAPVIHEVYSDNATVEDLIGDGNAFLDFHAKTASLPTPQINSIPIADGEENVIPGFRFMGQRFTIDAFVMQRLIYSSVKENSTGEKRMLPDVLDVSAALGSDIALGILEESGATEYQGYSENMEKLRTSLQEAGDTLWSASLYASWLHTLQPLLMEKGEGYPIFMQSEEWSKKDLECFTGSFTELKHDTILYSKQVMAEMGGGMEEEPDDRGYVEPEPLVYERFTTLATKTLDGLKQYRMLSDADEENLSRLAELANQLYTISIKELSNETLTDDEYELIRSYGGNIEHFWYDAMKAENQSDVISSKEYPSALVVDIATDPNGTVLEAATGNPSQITVAVMVDGRLKLATGSVYSFYQFTQPIDDRLTDSQWRWMMGIQANGEGYYNTDEKIKQPSWTDSYRYRYEWE